MTTIEVVSERNVTQVLETMLLIRTFEEKSAALKAAGQSPSMCTSVGQEASAAGVMQALDERDLILTNHRSAGHLLARGADPSRVMAEILGKSTGYCQGKSGSLHISAKELGVVLTSTIVGGELSLVTGVGLSLSMAETDAIAVVFFGDGAAAEEDQSAFQVVLDRRKAEARVHAQLAVGEFRSTVALPVAEELPEDAAGNVADQVFTIDENAIVVAVIRERASCS